MSEQLPAVAVVITHEVEDWDNWKPGFDAHAEARKEAGVLGHHINRGADNPNLLAVYLPATDKDKVTELLADDETRKKMAQAGVKGTPDIKFMKPVLNASILDRALAGMIVAHEVADFDKWKTTYDGFDSTRIEAGIVGHAVNQALDNPNMVVVYHQAETVDALKAFMANDKLKAGMKEAGVTSAPQVSFWNAIPGAQY